MGTICFLYSISPLLLQMLSRSVPLRTCQTRVPTCRHAECSGLSCSVSTSAPWRLCRGTLGIWNIKHGEVGHATQPYGEPKVLHVGAFPEKSARSPIAPAMALKSGGASLGHLRMDKQGGSREWSTNKAVQVKSSASGAFSRFQTAAVLLLSTPGRVKPPARCLILEYPKIPRARSHCLALCSVP